MDNTKQKPSEAVERRLRIASHILGLYKPRVLEAEPFDRLFNNLTNAAEYLERAYYHAKRTHIYAARGLETCTRIANRVVNCANSASSALSHGINAASMLQQQLALLHRKPRLPKRQDIVLDLEALERDFPIVKYDTTSHSLVVTTDPITLEHAGMSFDFGEFQITLDMTAVAAGASKPYEIKALDPRWTPDRAYCHPHLTGRDLCAGDGGEAARRATADGRLYDFFVIVNQILNTYNPDSPYARLEVWVNGRYEDDDDDDDDTAVCEICQESVEIDDLYRCGNCERHICSSCSSHCSAQGETYCNSCINDGDCECTLQGSSGCVVEENDSCLGCNEIPSNDELHTCAHMYRPLSYSNSRSHAVSMCTSCAQEHADERTPCTLSEYVVDENDQRQLRSGPCPHFGTDDCMLVVDMDMEMEEEAEPESEEAETAEQGAASAGE